MRLRFESHEEREARLRRWNRWFAWYPILGNGEIVWFETVEIRLVQFGGEFPDRYEYRMVPH